MINLIGKAQAVTRFPTLEPISAGARFETIALYVANWIIFLAGAIAVIYLVYGGILYITAGGDAEKATKGRTAVINAVIGIIIILLALIVIQWVRRFLESGTP